MAANGKYQEALEIIEGLHAMGTLMMASGGTVFGYYDGAEICFAAACDKRFFVAKHRDGVNLLRASLAVQQYYRKHGELPEKLMALVEEGFLKEVPRDCFSGLPIRYSRETAEFWSTGPDMEDNGGRLQNSPAIPPNGKKSKVIAKTKRDGMKSTACDLVLVDQHVISVVAFSWRNAS